jgi:hypothetical protein
MKGNDSSPEETVDVRILALSGRIFELITVWALQKEHKIIAQQVDMQSFDIIVFDEDDKLAKMLGIEQDGKPALISIKAREGHLNGVRKEEAEKALKYGKRLGLSKLLYGACFFDGKNIGKFQIYLFPIKEALSASVDRESIRFMHLIEGNRISKPLRLAFADSKIQT